MVGEGFGDKKQPASRARAPSASAPVVASGQAIGGATVTGVGRFVSTARDVEAFRPGEILLAEFTLPEWRSAMQRAAAIVTNQGGDASHAATVARELGVPAVVGTVDGAPRRWTGALLTVCCAGGDSGRVYEGAHQPPAGERDKARPPS